MDAQHKPNGAEPPPLPMVEVSSFVGVEPPPRAFLDSAGLIPMRNVTLLSGDGGTGKSLLALQLALAVSTVLPHWIGIPIAAESNGGVIYLSAEDDMLEIHKRLVEICAAEGAELERAVGLLSFIDLAGEDATLAQEKAHSGVMGKTLLYDRLEATIRLRGPIAVILDNLADTYAGNENNRGAVKQFVGLLRHLAMVYDCAIVLLGHPSVAGRMSGSGESGSTAWNNSVRSRLYLHRPEDQTDENARVLESMKANYGPTGRRFGLNWHDGRFVAKDEAQPFDKVKMDDQRVVGAEFERGSWRTNEQSEDWGGYFVASLLDLDVGVGVPAGERSKAQQKNRQTVRVILATWLRNKVITKVSRMDEGQRKTREFFGGATGGA